MDDAGLLEDRVMIKVSFGRAIVIADNGVLWVDSVQVILRDEIKNNME